MEENTRMNNNCYGLQIRPPASGFVGSREIGEHVLIIEKAERNDRAINGTVQCGPEPNSSLADILADRSLPTSSFQFRLGVSSASIIDVLFPDFWPNRRISLFV
jgi:hypothetical protein